MKIISFKYTDSKGRESFRDILVTREPTDKYSGIDLKALATEDVPAFRLDMEVAKDKYMEEVAAINYKYGTENSFRQFIPDRMEDITEVL